MASSQQLFERALRRIPGGVNSPVRAFRGVGGTPFFTERADGCRLYTADGRELIDYVCTWGPAILGHNAPVIREAVAAALEKGTSFGTPNPYEVEMAETVCALVPSVEKVRMVNSGTEATLSAVRLARGFTGRDKIIKFAGCYHGHVDSLLVQAGSGALTLGRPDSAGIPASLAAETIVLPFNDEDAVREVFSAHGSDIAAVIVEPYPANCGLLLPRKGYLAALREVTEKHGALLVFDEVMTGFRLGLSGVQGRENVTPDLSAFGKIIGGGLPVGAIGGRADVMDHLAPEGPVYQAGTLSGNPLAMAAGLAALRALQERNPYGELEEAGRFLAGAIREAAAAKGLPVQVPQTGSMFCLFFSENPVRNFEEAVRSNGKGNFGKFFHALLEAGAYLPPSAFETCFISVAHDREALEKTADAVSTAFRML